MEKKTAQAITTLHMFFINTSVVSNLYHCDHIDKRSNFADVMRGCLIIKCF